MRARFGAISMARCGEARNASTSARPVRLPLNRRNSSADTITTSSLPRTETCCGPALCASRTTSLNLAFASCSRQRPGSCAARRLVFDVGGELVMLTSLAWEAQTVNAEAAGALRCRQDAGAPSAQDARYHGAIVFRAMDSLCGLPAQWDHRPLAGSRVCHREPRHSECSPHFTPNTFAKYAAVASSARCQDSWRRKPWISLGSTSSS